MTCGQNCPARFGGKTIECGLSRGHDPRQPHLAVVAGQNVTWFNSEAPTRRSAEIDEGERRFTTAYEQPEDRKLALAALRRTVLRLGFPGLPPKELSGVNAAALKSSFVDIGGGLIAREVTGIDVRGREFGRFDVWVKKPEAAA